jgi:hypothetical protein
LTGLFGCRASSMSERPKVASEQDGLALRGAFRSRAEAPERAFSLGLRPWPPSASRHQAKLGARTGTCRSGRPNLYAVAPEQRLMKAAS